MRNSELERRTKQLAIELLIEARAVTSHQVQSLMQQSDTITAMAVSSIKTARSNR